MEWLLAIQKSTALSIPENSTTAIRSKFMANISASIVIASIEQALNLEPGTVQESSSAEQIEAWDSLGHLSVLVTLDKLFNGQLARIGEMADANSIPKIVSILQKHALL